MTDHEGTNVLSIRVKVFLDTDNIVWGIAFITLDPFVIINVYANTMASKELVFQMEGGLGQNIANCTAPVEVLRFLYLLPLRDGGYY